MCIFPCVKDSARQIFIKIHEYGRHIRGERTRGYCCLIPGIVFCRVVSRGLNSRVALTSICRNPPLCAIGRLSPKLSRRRTRASAISFPHRKIFTLLSSTSIMCTSYRIHFADWHNFSTHRGLSSGP